MLVRHFEIAKLATILVLLRIRNTRMLKYEEMKKYAAYFCVAIGGGMEI